MGYLLGGCRKSGPSKSFDFDPFVGCETVEYRRSTRCVLNFARLASAPGLCTCVILWGSVLVLSLFFFRVRYLDDIPEVCRHYLCSAQPF